MHELKEKKILIFGGSGSLGRNFIRRHINDNLIINYSRDEWKHWQIEHEFRSPNLINIIGDIRDQERIDTTLRRHNPNVVIMASALKHIERVEYAIHESIGTNLAGIANILNSIEASKTLLTDLETIVFVSTDKACSPINVYGLCKALAEKMVIEKSHYLSEFNFVISRYGNVLNSKGSIIPLLHRIGKMKDYQHYTLTHSEMTRFIMTLDESCALIEYAIEYADSGDIVIPKLNSFRVEDLFTIFSELYKKPIKIGGLRYGEKIHEALINETQSLYLEEKEKYYHIRPPHVTSSEASEGRQMLHPFQYDSSQSPIKKQELLIYLENLGMISADNTF